MTIGMQELVELIQSDSPEWRDQLENFLDSDEVTPAMKAIMSGVAAKEMIREDNPEDYPTAVVLLERFIQLEDDHLAEERISYIDALIRLFARMHNWEAAKRWFEVLKEIEHSGSHHQKALANRHMRFIRADLAWLW